MNATGGQGRHLLGATAVSYLGLDIGTTGCKAARFDGDGRPLAFAYREYPLLSPQPGWAEIDSEQVCRECFAVIREAAPPPGDPIAAIGISCQGEAFTPVGADGRMLARAMVSSDSRAVPLVERFGQQFDPRRLYEITGHTPHPMFTLYKLLWLKQERPEIWDAARRFYCFEDLFQSRLGLEPGISWPLAGRTMLFDVRRHQWDEQILDRLELDPSRLARPVPSGAVVGAISRAVAGELGLGGEVLVVAGGHDQPTGALGAGIAAPGKAMYATGTVECICPCFDRPILADDLFRNNLCTYDYTLPDTYTTVAFSLTGGNLLRWFRDQWAQAEVEAAARSGDDPYELILRGLSAEPTNLVVLPYFTPSGTPYFDARLPGAVLGLRLSTTRGEFLRGLLEGVALEMRLNVEILERVGLPIAEFRAIGGGARSTVLTELKAAVLSRPITTLAVTEAGCLGAALLACSAHTGAPPRDLAAHWVKPRAAIEPNPQWATRYDEKFHTYRELYPTLKEFYRSSRRNVG